MKLKYIQPNIDKDIKRYEVLLDKLKKIDDYKQGLTIIEKINKIRDNFFSMYWLSYINYLLDVNSEYWNKTEEFFSKYNPIMENLKLTYYQVLNESRFKDEYAKEIGNKVFEIASLETKLLNDNILEELKKEKELGNKYHKLIASSKVIFNKEELPLSKIGKYTLSSDRYVRIAANKAKFELFASIENKIDNILDELIRVRTNIAKKLGYKSYTDVGYIQMRRIGYDKKDVKMFRDNIIKYIVPLINKLKEKQKKELQIGKLLYYDDNILFKDGNATPKGDTKWIVNQALKMYESISPKLSLLFNKMNIEGLMDLDSKDGKSGGGIATYIPNYKVPVFISNFNGTSRDIVVLTHEFGHSFQLYSSRNLKYYENWWPTFDACEIHSKSMELLTLPYMNLFFDKDAHKYVYEELYTTLKDMCYIALVDEFQHLIYDKHDLTINERKENWRNLEKKYMPWLDFEDNNYLERGNTWQKQSHIFSNPFYYIDYALADSIALQFYALSLDNEKETWNKYIDFCSQGGMYSFVDTVKKVGMKSPFDENTLKEIVKKISNYI